MNMVWFIFKVAAASFLPTSCSPSTTCTRPLTIVCSRHALRTRNHKLSPGRSSHNIVLKTASAHHVGPSIFSSIQHSFWI